MFVNVSPAITAPSRVSRNATWPGVCPGVAITSRLPTRSPACRRWSGTVFSVGQLPGRLLLGVRLAGVDLGVELGHQHRHVGAEPLAQRVERADVVAVTVGEGDPPDLAAGLAGGRDQIVGGPHRGVDEREAVVLAHEERVDEAKASQLEQVVGHALGFHAPIVTAVA